MTLLTNHPYPTKANFSDSRPKRSPDAAEWDDDEAEQEQDDDTETDTSTESEAESDKNAVRPPQVTLRRKVQNAKFSSWLTRRAQKVTKEDAKVAIQKADDETLSTRHLMSKQESNVIITDPREYQIELFERAKQQNIIAVLDTGSGKTLIAVLLLKWILDQELEDRAAAKPPRIAFFVVDCVTLVFQQFAVLECNLDQKIDRFCGEMNTDLYDKETWNKHFRNNMAIVCTAEVLYQCLMHSFIAISQINLLIFDEAHHAKKNHAYARIIKDFYLAEEDPTKRPRIFGMTASPVDAKVDVVQAAKELEALLHCQIATTADLSLLKSSISRPVERIADYDAPLAPYETALCEKLARQFGDLDSISRLVRVAALATSELGEWCADQLWYYALGIEEASNKAERQIERLFNAEKITRPVEELNTKLRRIREAKDLVSKHSFLPPAYFGNHLSSKVKRLKDYLEKIFERPTDARCIIFVKKRFTARVLADLFKRIGNPHMRIDILIGSRSGEAQDIKVTFRQQVVTLMKFRKGQLNCLFATSIAEEGLDIPDCNTIIRFDLYDTLIQYIQSRGRARHKNSKYLHMIQRGSRTHLQAIRDVQLGEQVLRDFCEALPADRLLQGNDSILDDVLMRERSLQIYTEPTTGAKLTYGSCLTVIAHFVACLPYEADAIQQAIYIMNVENRKYVCEVLLPEKSPIRTVFGQPSSRKSIAKRSAAFEACLQLRKGGYLDGNMLPTYHKQLPAMRNARLALDSGKSNAYEYRIKPKVWESTRGTLPEQLYLTVFNLTNPECLGLDSYQALGMLTRIPLPEIPKFPLYLLAGEPSDVVTSCVTDPMKVPREMLATLTSYTLRMFQDIFNKLYEVNESIMSYWLVPIVQNPPIDFRDQSPHSLIDWSIIKFVHENEEIVYEFGSDPEKLTNRYLVDKWDGGRRFFTKKYRPDMLSTDPVPENCAPSKYKDNIIEYTVSLFAKSRAKIKWRTDQPVIEAQRILHRRNLLDDMDNNDKDTRTLAFIIPEPLKHSALPTTSARMGYLLPAIVWRLEQYLVVLEACEMLGLQIKPHLALEAMTKDSDNTEEHRSEQIHVRRGMGKNYERLEFIGDVFLKMATSISLYSLYAADNEFAFHVKRMLMITNANLFKTARETKLYEYIRSHGFSRRTWYPEGMKLLVGKGINKTGLEVIKHQLGDKTLADVCEALIGAALLTDDTGNMDMAVRAVTVFVMNTDHKVDCWDDYYKLYQKPAYQIGEVSASQRDLADQVEREHDYHFKYPRLLRSAFTHPSFPFSWEKIPSYQRLEFLGDALLDMACVNFLFHRFTDRDPQWLTEHKMALVSNKFLGALCVKLGFHKHLRLNSPSLIKMIQDYVLEVQETELESEGARDYWTMTTANPPKCLPDTVEAYLGALFVDSEYNYKEIERFFDAHIAWFFEDMTLYDTFANNHPTTYLNNLLTLELGCTNYRLMAGEVPQLDPTAKYVAAAVMVHGEVIAEGTAVSSKYAKLKAASDALELLRGLAPFEFRERYGCDCKTEEDMGDAEGSGNGDGDGLVEGIRYGVDSAI